MGAILEEIAETAEQRREKNRQYELQQETSLIAYGADYDPTEHKQEPLCTEGRIIGFY